MPFADQVFLSPNPPSVAYVESNFFGMSFKPESQSVIGHYQIDGNKIFDWTKSMCGWTEYDFARKVISRFVPEDHPRANWLYCTNVDFVRELAEPTPLGPSGTLEYATVEMSAEWVSYPGVLLLDDSRNPGGFTSEEWRYTHVKTKANLDARPLPKAALAYNEPPNEIVSEPASQVQQSRTKWVKWLQIPIEVVNSIPMLPGRLGQTIGETCGCMNSDVFLGMAKQTALLVDYDLEFRLMYNGQLAADLTYTILNRGETDVSGNALKDVQTATADFTRILRATGLYGRVFRRSDATKTKSIYGVAEFSRLFKFD